MENMASSRLLAAHFISQKSRTASLCDFADDIDLEYPPVISVTFLRLGDSNGKRIREKKERGKGEKTIRSHP